MSYGDQRGPKDKPFKVLAPPKHAGRVVNVKTETDVSDVLNRALGVIKQQVDNIAAKSRLGKESVLPEHDIKTLRSLVQSLVEVSREDRERTKHDGIEDWIAQLSTEELVKMAQGQLAQSANLDGALEVSATSSTDDDEVN